MPREEFEFSCPCCGKRVELNVRSGKVRAVNPEEKKGGKGLDELLSDQRHESERLASAFDDARTDQASEAEKLDDLFREAKRAAKDDDRRPPHPFRQD